MNTPSVVNFGTCWGTPNGQDLSMPSYMATGTLVVVEAILRRWTTPRGTLIDDPNYGESVLDMVSDDLSPSDIQYKQQQLAAEALKDERVLRFTVALTLTAAGLLTLAANGLTAAGPFKFVAAAGALASNGGQAGIQLLTVSP